MSILAGIVEGFLNSLLQFGFAFKSDNLDHEIAKRNESEDSDPPAVTDVEDIHETGGTEQD